MKGIVRDIIFVLIVGIMGVACGTGIAAVLGAIAVPGHSDMLLTLREKADLDAMRTGLLSFLGSNSNGVIAAAVVLAIAVFFLVLTCLNPNFRSLRKPGVIKKKAVFAIFGGMIVFFLLLVFMMRMPLAMFSGNLSHVTTTGAAIVHALIAGILCGLLWVLVGETGWAGDLLSWRPGSSEMVTSKVLQLTGVFLMGAACGVIGSRLLVLYNWAFTTYFLLVCEVLSGAGEPTLRGWNLIAASIMVMLGFSFAIIAGFITVLAPRRMTVTARLLRLVLPAVFFAVYGGLVLGTYRNAVVRYDLGKKDLAEAVGIPRTAGASKTVIVFIPEKATLQEWRMEAAGTGLMIQNNAVALSDETLAKIGDYVDRHSSGSVFYYAARDALVKGYFKLWETGKGNAEMFKSADRQMIPRMILLKRLSEVPATAENEVYLRDFADGTKWYASKRSSLRIAEAFMHFGRPEEAMVWAKRAKAEGADAAAVASLMKETVPPEMTVTGTIHLNGAPLAARKVALFAYRPKMAGVDPKNFTGYPIDARMTDQSGSFRFTGMGAGKYVLAVMVEAKEVPFATSAERMMTENAPGIIKVGRDDPAQSLGRISVTVK